MFSFIIWLHYYRFIVRASLSVVAGASKACHELLKFPFTIREYENSF